MIEHSLLKADIASIPLQKLRPSHIEAYYANAGVSASTLTLHHTILHSALRKAVKDRLIAANVAVDLDGKPRRGHEREDARRGGTLGPPTRSGSFWRPPRLLVRMGILGVECAFHSTDGRFKAQVTKKGVQLAARTLKWRDEPEERAHKQSNDEADSADR